MIVMKRALKKWISILVDNRIKISSRLRKISVIKQFFSFLIDEKFIHIILHKYKPS